MASNPQLRACRCEKLPSAGFDHNCFLINGIDEKGALKSCKVVEHGLSAIFGSGSEIENVFEFII